METAMSASNVPTIDMRPWFSGDSDKRTGVARAVGDACENIGFFAVVGHGVEDDVISTCREAAEHFFDQPLQTKMSVAQQGGSYPGYIGFAQSTIAHSMGVDSPPDLREIFGVGPIDVDRTNSYYSNEAAAYFFAPNVWPASPPGFKDALVAYYRALDSLANSIMQIFAVALNLEKDFFAQHTDRSISMLEILNYPALTAPPLTGQMRVGEHSDYGSVTILLHEKRPGNLQVRNRDGQWIDVEAIPGALLINIGDLMAQWTNDRWVSTVHRVLAPPPEHLHDSRRISIPFFQQPNYDALITPLDDAKASKYRPETVGDYVHRKLSAVFS
jgi:isopenicillin N synthase-like dioxygenase